MDEIKVDPKLFVTCRLCLEDLGQYQIVPSVQQQINYCFDIEVEPFDGLPQLICMKCKEILVRFHTIKTTFCEKQNNLRNKVIKKDEIFSIQPQQDTVSSSQQASDTIELNQPTNHLTSEPCNSKKKKSKRKRLVLQSSTSDVESEKSLQTSTHKRNITSRQDNNTTTQEQHINTNATRGLMPWKAEYMKFLSCKLCNSVWPDRQTLEVHSQCHDLLRVKYKNIFNRQCTVKMIKIDDKPNITGLSKMVVHSNNKIIEPGNSYFYTIYSKENVSPKHSNSESFTNNDDNFSRESSDDNEEIVFKPTQRKRRLISRSSNETVVIESNSNKIVSDDENSKTTATNSIEGLLNNDQCINIDDSSDSECEQSILEKSGNFKQPIEAKIGDYKIIQGIISMCVNSYHKKNESPEVDMLYMNVNQNKKKDNVKISNESQLKHKVLSIGRKIINKQGFNCTGLLRYMENKSLEIVWMAKAQLLYPKDTNYIRILTKLRGDLNLDDESGWVNVPEVSQLQSFNLVPLTNSIKIAAPIKTLSNVPVSNDSAAAKITKSMLAKTETSQSEKINNQAQLDAMPAMLYLDSKGSTSDSKKLLNANPVANPKQLPKKLGPGNESRSNKTIAQQSIGHTTTDVNVNFCMPVITSTTSLATIPSKEQTQDANQEICVASKEIKETETPAPRIKVKPVSELMPQHTINSMKEQTMTVTNSNMFVSQIENAWHQRPLNAFIPNMALPMLVTSPPPLSILQTQKLNADTAYQEIPGPISSNTISEYVILDSTDFPNTKTESPFRYVKDLLQMHNIFLLDPYEKIPEEFHSLIKFKVLFKQDNLIDSVAFCLSLFCFKNTFSFQIKDGNQKFVDINTISAKWQWEILQTYRGDVSNKMLKNAQKLGQETYDFTKKFFCLLKAINCRKPC